MASELVKQVSARRNFNKDAVDMGDSDCLR